MNVKQKPVQLMKELLGIQALKRKSEQRQRYYGEDRFHSLHPGKQLLLKSNNPQNKTICNIFYVATDFQPKSLQRNSEKMLSIIFRKENQQKLYKQKYVSQLLMRLH